MQLEFPYQIVTFIDQEPNQGEPVYNGSNGWYAQVAIKRRFALRGISEDNFINSLTSFFETNGAINITTGGLVKPEHMPVQVIHIDNQSELKDLHERLLESFSDYIVSKFPEREGDNYYPHITAEYNGSFVIPVDQYEYKQFHSNNIWLLKDLADDDSIAFAKIR